MRSSHLSALLSATKRLTPHDPVRIGYGLREILAKQNSIADEIQEQMLKMNMDGCLPRCPWHVSRSIPRRLRSAECTAAQWWRSTYWDMTKCPWVTSWGPLVRSFLSSLAVVQQPMSNWVGRSTYPG